MDKLSLLLITGLLRLYGIGWHAIKIFLDELVDNPGLLIAEVEDLKRELLALGKELENLQLDNDRLQIKLELEGKSKELENCTNFQELSDGLNNLLQQRIKKTNLRPSNRNWF